MARKDDLTLKEVMGFLFIVLLIAFAEYILVSLIVIVVAYCSLIIILMFLKMILMFLKIVIERRRSIRIIKARKNEAIFTIEGCGLGWSRHIDNWLEYEKGLYFICFNDGLGKWGKSTNLKKRLADYDKPDKKLINCVHFKIIGDDIHWRETDMLKMARKEFTQADRGEEYFWNVSNDDGVRILKKA